MDHRPQTLDSVQSGGANGDVARDFSRFDKVRFINLVRKHEALYVHQHPNYANRQYVDPIYEKIAAEVGLKGGATAARNKWNSLKICYKFHKLKLQNPTNKKKKPLKKWPYFEMMQFMDQYTMPRKKESSRQSLALEPQSASTCSSYFSDASHPTIEISDADPKLVTEFFVKQEPLLQGMTGDNQISMALDRSPQNDWQNTVNIPRRSNGTAGATADMDCTQLAELVTAVRDLEAAVSLTSRHENDDDAQYGRFIASRLQKLTPRQKHSIRKGIEDVFYEVESHVQHHVPTVDSVMGEMLN